MKRADTMADCIETIVRYLNHVSFVELSRRVGGFDGSDFDFCLATDQNIVMWPGLSREAVEALDDVLARGTVKIKTTKCLTYLMDGQMPSLPLVKRPPKSGYKHRHWLPSLLVLTEKGHALPPVGTLRTHVLPGPAPVAPPLAAPMPDAPDKRSVMTD